LADENKDDEQPPPHYEGGIPILPGNAERADSARRAEKREEEKYKDRQTSIQRGLLVTQIILVVFGVFGTGISYYQARTAQLSAESAKRAADTADESYQISSSDFERTMRQTITQTVAQIKAAEAAEKSIAQQDADRRPYVTCRLLGTMQLPYGKIISSNTELINWGPVT
jgi:uncharacterized protein HemX